MGLSHPVKSKVLERHGDENFKIGISSMQGFRLSSLLNFKCCQSYLYFQ